VNSKDGSKKNEMTMIEMAYQNETAIHFMSMRFLDNHHRLCRWQLEF